MQLLYPIKIKLKESLYVVVYPDVQSFNNSLSFKSFFQTPVFLCKKAFLKVSQVSKMLFKYNSIQTNTQIIKIQI